MTTKKIYSKQTMKDGLHWYVNTDSEHLTMRFAGKPSLLLEQYRGMYGEDGDKMYLELLELLKNIGDNGMSPFVFYSNKLKKQ